MAQILKLEDENRYFGKDQTILHDFNEAYEFAFRNMQPWVHEADNDLKFYLGDQWSAHEKRLLFEQKRSALVFNKIRRIVKMIGGFERKTRMSLIAEPIEFQDEQLANDWSAILLHQMNVANMHMVMSEAFEASLKVGMNLVNLSLDYDVDPLNGSPMLTRIPHTNFLVDPRFTKRDLSDAAFVLTRRLMSKESLMGLLPNKEEEIRDLQSLTDNKYPSIQSRKHFLNDDVVAVDEYWERKFKQVNFVMDRETGETIQFDNDEVSKDKLKFILHQNPQLVSFKRSVKTVQLNVLSEGQVLFSGEDPWKQGDLPHIPIMAFYDPEFSAGSEDSQCALRIQGVVRSLKDAQTEVNKRRSKALDILDSQINSGWKVKEGTLVNDDDLTQSGQGKSILLRRGALMTDLEKLPTPDVPPNMIAFSEIIDKDLMEIAGASSEMFGMPENENMQISGMLAKVRQGAGLTILQDLFDNYRYAQKLLGNKIIKTVKNNYDETKIARILGRPASPQFSAYGIESFDIVVEEAVETPNQKNLQFVQLMQARQAGINIPDSVIIDAMPLQNKDMIKQAIAQQAEQQQQLQMQQASDMSLLTQAKAMSERSQAEERTARVQENLSNTVENQADTALARAKTLKELEGMEIDKLAKLVEISQMMDNEAANQTQALYQQNKPKNLIANKTV